MADYDTEARNLLRDMGFDPHGLTTGDLAPLRNLYALAKESAGLEPELTAEIHKQMGRATEALIKLSNAVTARRLNLEARGRKK